MSLLCETCGSTPFKYKCPRCFMKSCSLGCVKQHKIEQNCSGVRCKTAYVPLESFTDQHLFSDYYFLEEVGRLADSSHRTLVCFNKDTSQSKRRDQNFCWLARRARERGITLKLLPAGMARHTVNTSRTVRDHAKKQWAIHWRVHLTFPECNATYEEESVPESRTVCSLLQHYLHPQHSHPVIRHRLRHHVVNEGVAGVEVWLEGGGGVAHQLLDMELTLEMNLKNKTLVEFPVLLVVTKGTGPPRTNRTTCSEDVLQQVTPTPVKDTPPQATPTPVKDTPPQATPTPVSEQAGESSEMCRSDSEWWCDGNEEGEIACSSLQLIADMYSESDSENS